MEMQTKNCTFELKGRPDEDGTIEGYASVFEVVDDGMDIIATGAFRKSLNTGRKVRMLWQHEMSEPIGVWDTLKEDSKGLYCKGRILANVSRGRDALELFRAGAMDSLSIGFRIVEAEKQGSGAVRRITEVELWEISAVTIPMNKHAIAQVKSEQIKTEREFEAFLRDAGYSRREAKALTCHGFKGLTGLRDAEPNEAENQGAKAFLDQIRQLQEKITNV